MKLRFELSVALSLTCGLLADLGCFYALSLSVHAAPPASQQTECNSENKLENDLEGDSQKKLVVLVGDSTVTDQAGWGKGFAELLNDQIDCRNISAGGRSSKSFRAEGRWDVVQELNPDYVLIQFGHNDQPGKGPARETDPQTTYQDNLRQYVREAQVIGSQPILVTSLARRQFNAEGKIQCTLGPYVAAARQVAEEMKVPVIDLHSSSLAYCEQLGPEKCREISPVVKEGEDRTHLNLAGSRLIAPLILEELCEVLPEFSAFRKEPSHK